MLRRIVLFLVMLSACGDDGPAGPPPPTSALQFKDIAVGYYHSCGLTKSGVAYCWGDNVFGTLGDGTTTDRLVATQVAGSQTFTSLDSGAGHNCGLTSAGVAWCWGHNDEGQLGDGTFAPRVRPTAVTGGRAYASISAGHAHSCAVTADGVAWCWGDNTRGQLGNPTDVTGTKTASPVRVQFDEPWAVVQAGYYQTCGLTRGGAAHCWGAGDSGQNGDGTLDNRNLPVRVQGNLSFTEIAPGDRFVCGVSAGAPWCWGANRHGELGVGGALSNVPVRLANAPALTTLFTSTGTSTIPSARAYACGVRSDGRGYCWGGEVRSLRAADPAVTELDERIRFRIIATGSQHICGLSLDGYAYCGGANYRGQSGDGTLTDVPRLTAIPGPSRR